MPSALANQKRDILLSMLQRGASYNEPSNSKSWKVLETVSSHNSFVNIISLLLLPSKNKNKLVKLKKKEHNRQILMDVNRSVCYPVISSPVQCRM